MVNAQKDDPLDKLKSRFLRKKPIFLLVCVATLIVGLSTLLTAIKNIGITVKDTVEERKLYSNANKASALKLGMYASSIFSFNPNAFPESSNAVSSCWRRYIQFRRPVTGLAILA